MKHKENTIISIIVVVVLLFVIKEVYWKKIKVNLILLRNNKSVGIRNVYV